MKPNPMFTNQDTVAIMENISRIPGMQNTNIPEKLIDPDPIILAAKASLASRTKNEQALAFRQSYLGIAH